MLSYDVKDTSARPGELLAVRIGDIKFKRANNDNRMFAEVEIGRYGKTKKSRIVPLIKSLPYLKAWLAQHPQSGNPNAYLFVSFNHKSKYTNTPLKPGSLAGIYDELHKKYFPKLLEKPDIPMQHDDNALQEGDRIKIRALLKKPWNPYIRRHTALTEKAPLLKDFNLRQHAGWVKSSNMVEIYTHELGGESSEDLLMACGIDIRASNKSEAASQLALQARACPHCSEPNKPDFKFCLSCGMVLVIDEYNATIQSLQEAENAKKELAALKAKQEETARKQQLDIEHMKVQLESNHDQVSKLLEMLSDIQKQEKAGQKNFILRKLGVLTNGEIGEDPESGIVTEPLF
jgi:integrase/recombinase XerD